MKLTLTGIDSLGTIDALLALLEDYPCLELGILYSEKRSPDPAEVRYPLRVAFNEMLNYLPGDRLAVHVCGGAARRRLADAELSLHGVARIQVNGAVKADELTVIAHAYPDQAIITQYPSSSLVTHHESKQHQILMDSSGGTGTVPTNWWRLPIERKRVGFAGGLNEGNLAANLRLIGHADRVVGYHAPSGWVDIETGVRTEDIFDVQKARRLCEIFTDAARRLSLAPVAMGKRGTEDAKE